MSQTEADTHDLSEDNVPIDEKTVPVSEAIRYRKRAQQAEKQLAELNEEVSQQRQQVASLNTQLAAVRRQQTLREALAAAGATDLETTMLLAEARLAADADADAGEVVDALRREKAFLFEAGEKTAAPNRTAGVRHRDTPHGALDSAAAQAAQSGSRADMQAYLRVRRAYV